MVDKEEKTKKFLADPEVAIFDEVQEVSEKMEEVKIVLEKYNTILEELKKKHKTPKDGKNGRDGSDGKDGESGKTPIRGIDYFTSTEQQELVAEVVNSIKKLIPDLITAKEIKNKLESLKDKERFDARFLNGLERYFKPEIIQPQGKNRGGIWNGSMNPFAVIVGALVAQNVKSITFLGVTMVNRNGDVTIAISGGSGTIVMSEVVSGDQNTFILAHIPVLGTPQIYANGQRLTPVVDYSISGAIITTILSWPTGSILADYEY